MSYSEGPDEGHAWVISIAASVLTLILSGISKMSGIFYVAIIETYGVSRKEAALPFTVRKSLRCLAGPVVGVVGERYGVKAVTLAGSVVAALGAALCFFAPNVTYFTVFWGGIHGIGAAFANNLFQITVNQYFEKYRSTASGIALSGACIGSACFSLLIEATTDAYGLQGTFLILSAIILNVVPAAILLEPPSWISLNKISQKTFKESIQESSKKYAALQDCVKTNSEKETPTFPLKSNRLEGLQGIFNVISCPFTLRTNTNQANNFEKNLVGKTCRHKPVFLPEKANSEEKQQTSMKNENIFATSRDTLYDKTFRKCDPKIQSSQISNSMLESVNTVFKLYKNPLFVLICFSMMAYVFAMVPLSTTIVDYGKDKGFSEDFGKYVINVMALGDFLGRLCFGWVTDKNFISLPRHMILTLVLQGVFIILLPFVYSLAEFLTFIAMYSMISGSMLVRIPVLVLNHVRIEHQTVAMGTYGFAAGFVPLCAPFLIGYFRDQIGSYDGMYYLLGIISVITASFWLLEPFLIKTSECIEGGKETSS